MSGGVLVLVSAYCSVYRFSLTKECQQERDEFSLCGLGFSSLQTPLIFSQFWNTKIILHLMFAQLWTSAAYLVMNLNPQSLGQCEGKRFPWGEVKLGGDGGWQGP